jgi:predicted  nucleic acid-binding Zn-ribbon protein
MVRRTRKNLSDLLREEVQKDPNPETSPAPAQDSQCTTLTPAITEDATHKIKELTDNLTKANEKTQELESQVKSLTTELTKQKSLADDLQKQLSQSQQLQEELTEQKQLVHRLYEELQQSKTLETELNEYRELVKQLQEEQEDKQEPKGLVKQNSSEQITRTSRLAHAIHYIDSPRDDINKNLGWFD